MSDTDSEQFLDKHENLPFINDGVDDSGDESSQDLNSTTWSENSWSTRIRAYAPGIASLLFVILCVIITIGFGRLMYGANSAPGAFITKNSHASATTTTTGLAPTISCGRHPSTQQRRDGECIFDPMLLAWMPRPCVNFELMHATLNTSSEVSFPPYEISGTVTQQVYADPQLTRQLPAKEIQQMNQHPFYVTLRFHRAHCAYMFRLVAAAAGQKTTLDGNADPDAGIYGVSTGHNTKEAPSAEGVYVWQEAIRPMHVDHCIKVLAWRGGDLDASEKFYGSSGRCVLI